MPADKMRLVIALFWLAAVGGISAAGEVPLPRPRPTISHEPLSFSEAAGPDFDLTAVTNAPTDCDRRLQAIAVLELLPRLIGPGACGGNDMLRLEAVLRPDRGRIELHPPATLTCVFAEALAIWLREQVTPQLMHNFDAAPRTVEIYDDFNCRSRNRISGSKISEHGKGNAIDIRSFVLDDGRKLELTDVFVDRDQREELRSSSCRRFTTVLGPGSDGYHESHVHLDLIQRRHGLRLCQWDVREPAKREIASQVPLPVPRPERTSIRQSKD
ncbi:MAG TPA: extensin family protein [Pseudolabrys sp.]|nr:extensin family protein [Pseudolabrys sp.]